MTRARDNSNILGTSGTNGQVLTIDTNQNNGYAFENPAQYVAGKNFIINGGFDIWQRGTGSFSAGVYCADRFISGGGGTFTQSTSVVPANFRYSLSITGSGAPQAWISQVIETSNTIPLAGKTIALSAYVAANTSVPLTFYVYYATTVDATYSGGSWTGVTVNNLTNGTPTSTTFNRMTATANIPSNATSLLVQIGTVGSLANTSTYYVSGFQLELGSVATSFSRAGGTIQHELIACQRYYQILGNLFGYAFTTTAIQGSVSHQPMRAQPTVIMLTTSPYGESPINVTAHTASGANAFGSGDVNQYGPSFLRINGFSGMTSGNPAYVLSDQIALSAEL